MREPVALALSTAGEPTAMTWGEVDYAVTDRPTRLEREPYFVTHPPPSPLGWRFQGRSASGDNQIFDVCLDPRGGQWLLVGIYG